MIVPDRVVDLVDRFRENEGIYRSPDYKEAHIRQDFIDPFFEALGWDLRNEEKVSEIYREVIFEDAIKIGGSTKAPDYCFLVGGSRKFFVEANAFPAQATCPSQNTPAKEHDSESDQNYRSPD